MTSVTFPFVPPSECPCQLALHSGHLNVSRRWCCALRKGIRGVFSKTTGCFSSSPSIMNEQCPSNIWNAVAVTEHSFSNEAKHKITDDKCRIINCARRSLFSVKLCIYAPWYSILGGSLHWVALGRVHVGKAPRTGCCSVSGIWGLQEVQTVQKRKQAPTKVCFFKKKRKKKSKLEGLQIKYSIQYRLGYSITHLKTG